MLRETQQVETGTPMSFDKNLLQFRKARGLTQEQMAQLTGIHVNSIKVYESGKSQPSLDAFKRIVKTLSVSADELLFDEHERQPADELRLAFDAVSHMREEDKQTVLSLIEGMILKHQARTLLGGRKAS